MFFYSKPEQYVESDMHKPVFVIISLKVLGWTSGSLHLFSIATFLRNEVRFEIHHNHIKIILIFFLRKYNNYIFIYKFTTHTADLDANRNRSNLWSHAVHSDGLRKSNISGGPSLNILFRLWLEANYFSFYEEPQFGLATSDIIF